MSERNYYVLCDDNCRFPSMTAEQILEAIAEATGATPTHIDDAFITKIKEKNTDGNLTFWIGTQAQYNAIEEPEQNCLYIITDEERIDERLAEVEQEVSEIKGVVEYSGSLSGNQFTLDNDKTLRNIFNDYMDGKEVNLVVSNDEIRSTIYRLMFQAGKNDGQSKRFEFYNIDNTAIRHIYRLVSTEDMDDNLLFYNEKDLNEKVTIFSGTASGGNITLSNGKTVHDIATACQNGVAYIQLPDGIVQIYVFGADDDYKATGTGTIYSSVSDVSVLYIADKEMAGSATTITGFVKTITA